MVHRFFQLVLLLGFSIGLVSEGAGQTGKVFSFTGPAGETIIGTGSITKAMMLQDGNIITGGSIGYLLWDGQTGDFRQWIGGKPYHAISVLDFDLHPHGDSILSAGANGDVKLIQIDTGEEKAVVDRGKDLFPSGLRFSPDGSKILVVYDDQVQVRDSQTAELLKSYDLAAEDQYVMKAEFVPGSSDVAILIPGNGRTITVRFWNWETDAKHDWEVGTYTNGTSVQLLEDGEGLLIQSSSGTMSSVALWNLVTQAQELIQYDLINITDANDRSPDGRFLAMADPRRISVVDIQQSKEIALLDVSNASWFSFSPDGSELVVTRSDAVEVWDVQTQKSNLTIKVQPAWLDAAVSPDGQKILAATGSRLVLIDKETLSILAETETDLGGNIAFTSDGRFIVQYTDDDFRVLNGETLQIVRQKQIPGSLKSISLGALSPDGMTFAYVLDKMVRIEDLNGNLLSAFPLMGGLSQYLDMALTNQELILLSQNKTFNIWNFRTQSFADPTFSYTYSNFADPDPDKYGPIYRISYGKGFLFSSNDMLQYMEISTDWMSSVLKNIKSPLSALWISDNKMWMITGEQNGSVGLWAFQPMKKIAMWTGHANFVNRVQLSANGKTLVSAGMDNTIRLYPLPATTPITEWMNF